jgi:hypothetical protein
MLRIAAFLALAVGLAACGLYDAMVDGWKHKSDVEADLELSTSMKSSVGFNWSNGRLRSVTVQFPKLYTARPLPELADMVQRSVTSHFQQKPDVIILSFALGKSDTVAQLQNRPWRIADEGVRRLQAGLRASPAGAASAPAIKTSHDKALGRRG